MDSLRALRHDVRGVFSRKLGRCTRCIRASAVGSAVAWAVVAGALLAEAPGLAVAAVLVPAAAFTMLALAHAGAYGRRLALTARQEAGQEASARRAFLGDALKFGSGGLAAALGGTLLRPSIALGTHCGSCPGQEGPAKRTTFTSKAGNKSDAMNRAIGAALNFCDGACSQYGCIDQGDRCEVKEAATEDDIDVDCDRDGDGWKCTAKVFSNTCHCRCG